MSDYSWIGPVVQAVGGVVGGAMQNNAAAANSDLMRQAYLRALGLLDSGELKYTPAQAQGMAPSAMNGVSADPASQLAEQEALSRLGEASRSGFDDIDRAALNRTMSTANANARGMRESALARLDPNSGAAIQARLAAQSSAANSANQQALDVAAMSRKRALDALGQYGNLASRMRGESFGEASDRARAQDAIAKFNSEVSQFNAGAKNKAMQQGIGNTVDAMGVAAGATGAYGGALLGQGRTAGKTAADAGSMLGNAANAYFSKDDEEEDK